MGNRVNHNLYIRRPPLIAALDEQDIDYGITEQLPPFPKPGDLFLDVEAEILYACFSDGTWTALATVSGIVTDHGALTGLTDDDHTQYRLESADHTHQTTGLQGGKVDHGLALNGLTDDDHTQYLKEKGQGGLASEVPTHTHASAAEAGIIYSVHQYIFTPDAAPGADIATGDQQGNIYVSGPTAETVKRIVSICETAPVTTAATFELEYGSTEDLDTPPTWTRIDLFSHTAGQKTVLSTSFDQTSIPAQRLIRMNVDAAGGTPAKDSTLIMEVWRPLKT